MRTPDGKGWDKGKRQCWEKREGAFNPVRSGSKGPEEPCRNECGGSVLARPWPCVRSMMALGDPAGETAPNMTRSNKAVSW